MFILFISLPGDYEEDVVIMKKMKKTLTKVLSLLLLLIKGESFGWMDTVILIKDQDIHSKEPRLTTERRHSSKICIKTKLVFLATLCGVGCVFFFVKL